jgi:hypothetical protein
MTLCAFGLDIEAVVLDVEGVLLDTPAAGCSVAHFATDGAPPSLRPAVATVRGHRDLLHHLGLEPLADTHGKGHP